MDADFIIIDDDPEFDFPPAPSSGIDDELTDNFNDVAVVALLGVVAPGTFGRSVGTDEDLPRCLVVEAEAALEATLWGGPSGLVPIIAWGNNLGHVL